MSRSKNSVKQIQLAKLFANRLKKAREKKGLSQNDLARETNISIDTIRSLENSRIKSPSLFMAFDLVSALDGSIEKWLIDIKKIGLKQNDGKIKDRT